MGCQDNCPEGVNPKVSVLIPCYNGELYIKEALSSVERQSYRNWEIILVDDCSTDHSFEIVTGFKEKLGNRLVIIRNPSNLGVSRTRNIAFDNSRGEYIAFLDIDDSWHPKKLEKQVELFLSDKTAQIVHTGIKVLTDSRTRSYLQTIGRVYKNGMTHWDLSFNDGFLRRYKEKKGDYFALLRDGNCICLSSGMVRRKVFLEINGFDVGLFYQVEDWSFWLKCSLLFKFCFIPEKLLYYHITQEGYTSRIFLQQDCEQSLARGQVHDRCAMFARRKGLKLSYTQLSGRPALVSSPLISVKKIKRKAKRFIRNSYGIDRKKRIARTCFFQKGLPKGRKLEQLILFVTGMCNLSCSECFYKKGLNLGNDIPFKHIEAILNSVAKINHILLTGGEPFLRDDIEDIILLCLSRCNVGLPTNGFSTGRINSIISSVLSKKPLYDLTVAVSVDGFEETHNRMRGNNASFLNALNTIRVLSSLQDRYDGFSISVNTLISPENLSEIVDFAKEFSQGFGFNYHNFEIERYSKDAMTSFKSQRTKLAKVYEDLLCIIRRYYPNYYLSDKLRFKIQYENMIKGSYWDFPCKAGQDSVAVYNDGTLAACEMRMQKINLADFNYNLSEALNTHVMKGEIKDISKGHCFCTHGCWLSISMASYFETNYRTRNISIALKYRRALDLFRRLPKGIYIGVAVVYFYENLLKMFRYCYMSLFFCTSILCRRGTKFIKTIWR